MIRFKNGHELTFACGSGALAFDGRGWLWDHPLRWLGILEPQAFTVVAKTVTVKPIKGRLNYWRPWKSVKLLDQGAVNCVGLTNPGINYWVKNHYPIAIKNKYDIACSIFVTSIEEANHCAKVLKDLSLAYLEVNISCCNMPELDKKANVLYLLKEQLKHPIVVKISHKQSLNKIFLQSIAPYVDAIHAINAVPWTYVFQDKPSPLEKYGQKGAVSGKPIKNLAREAIFHIRDILPNMPLIGGGGISELRDVYNFQDLGANAFSIGCLFLKQPWKPNQIVFNYNQSPV